MFFNENIEYNKFCYDILDQEMEIRHLIIESG